MQHSCAFLKALRDLFMSIFIQRIRKRSSTFLLSFSFVCLLSNVEAGHPFVTPAIFKPLSPYYNGSAEHNLAREINKGNITGILEQLQSSAELIRGSNDPIGDSRAFLQNTIDKMNAQFGTRVTLSEVVQFTRQSLDLLLIPGDEIDGYLLGLNLIEGNSSDYAYSKEWGCVNFAKHNRSSNFWTWLSVATVTAGAVVVCIFCPEATIPVINGAVEIGKTIIDRDR